MKATTRDKPASRVTAFVVLVAVFVLAPLPPAAIFGGIDWLTQGTCEGMREFIAAYVVGFIFFLGSFLIYLVRTRKSR